MITVKFNKGNGIGLEAGQIVSVNNAAALKFINKEYAKVEGKDSEEALSKYKTLLSDKKAAAKKAARG